MFGKYNGFVSKARVSACMYFLVKEYLKVKHMILIDRRCLIFQIILCVVCLLNLSARCRLNELCNGAISLLGRVGEVDIPHLILPLMVEPNQSRLCYDARFLLNLWIKDNPFHLDLLSDLPRYAERDSYQTVLDDKSGYHYLLFDRDTRQYFGIQWGGWVFL
jgi:hypothetical protein